MGETERQNDTAFAILAGTFETGAENMKYFFSAAMRKNFRTTSGLKETIKLFRSGTKPKVLVVGELSSQEEQLSLIRLVKALPTHPVIIAIDAGEDLGFSVKAFRAGVDEVVKSNISIVEFAYRLSSKLPETEHQSSDMISVDWDQEARMAQRAGLTSSEIQVLRVLMRKPGGIVSRDDLSEAIDSRPWSYGDRKYDVHIANLRKKLTEAFGPDVCVNTVRSAGYSLTMGDG